MSKKPTDPVGKALRRGNRARILVIVGLVLIAVSGPASKAGYVSPMIGMSGYTLASLFMIIALIMGSLSLPKAPTKMTWIVVAVAAIITGMNGLQLRNTISAPAIHDISTNVVSPPEFQAIIPLRADAPNPPQYNAAESAALQVQAFPDIETILIRKPAKEVFASALTVVNDMGWELVDAVVEEGRIEATASTAYLGFKDDVVIRIETVNGGSAVDIRSKSRMGKGDMGANAKRVRAFRDRLIKTSGG